MSHVVEIVLFKLNTDADESAFLEAAQATFDLLAGYDGFVSRELTVNDAGQWVDIVHWRDMETALAAAEQIMSNEIGQRFGSFIDFETANMMHTHPKIESVA